MKFFLVTSYCNFYSLFGFEVSDIFCAHGFQENISFFHGKRICISFHYGVRYNNIAKSNQEEYELLAWGQHHIRWHLCIYYFGRDNTLLSYQCCCSPIYATLYGCGYSFVENLRRSKVEADTNSCNFPRR